jgi:hypothetical protein
MRALPLTPFSKLIAQFCVCPLLVVHSTQTKCIHLSVYARYGREWRDTRARKTDWADGERVGYIRRMLRLAVVSTHATRCISIDRLRARLRVEDGEEMDLLVPGQGRAGQGNEAARARRTLYRILSVLGRLTVFSNTSPTLCSCSVFPQSSKVPVTKTSFASGCSLRSKLAVRVSRRREMELATGSPFEIVACHCVRRCSEGAQWRCGLEKAMERVSEGGGGAWC